MSGFQPLGVVGKLTQPDGLGWDMAAPLALDSLAADAEVDADGGFDFSGFAVEEVGVVAGVVDSF
jgi:hypothetical protein